jgi:hypothetical protein
MSHYKPPQKSYLGVWEGNECKMGKKFAKWEIIAIKKAVLI